MKELQKEELTLKQLIYEFTKELEKTTMEETYLRKMIEQQKAADANPNGLAVSSPTEIVSIQTNPKQEQDDEDIDIQEPSRYDQEREELDGDTILRDMFADVLQGT